MDKQLREAQARHDKALADAKQVIDLAKAESRGFTDDERTRLDASKADAEKAKADIETIRADQQRLAAFDAQTAWGSARETHAVAAPEPVATGHARDVRITGGEASGQFGHFGEFLNAVRNAAIGNGIDRRLYADQANPTGLNTVVDSEGAYLVPKIMADGILQRMNEMGQILSRVRKAGLSSDNMTFNAVDETSRATGSRFGGIVGYWVEQGTAPTASMPKFSQISLKLKKLAGLGYMTDEMIADTAFTGTMLLEMFAQELTFLAENAIVNGTGAGCPLGWMTAPCRISVAKESTQLAATLCGDNLLSMWARLPVSSRQNAVWFYNQDCEPQLWKMSALTTAVKGATSASAALPLVLPTGVGLNQSGFPTILGRPLIAVEYCQTIGTEGDLILVDPTQYLFVDKGGVQTASSIHVRFAQGEQTFRAVYRCDGQPMWRSALTPFNGTNTVSPIITLAVRA